MNVFFVTAPEQGGHDPPPLPPTVTQTEVFFTIKKTIPIILLIFLLLCTTTLASEYLYVGGDSYNSAYTIGLTFINSSSLMIPNPATLNGSIPLVADLDDDGTNEIIMITDANIMYTQHYSSGAFTNINSYDVGTQDHYNQENHYTPCVVGNQIVMVNATHAFVLNSDLTLNQSVAIPYTNTSTPAFATYSRYFSIKCGSTGMPGGFSYAFFEFGDHAEAVTFYHTYALYDLTHNSIITRNYSTPVFLGNANLYGTSPYMQDIDNDGLVEAVSTIHNLASGIMDIIRIDIASNISMTTSLIYQVDRANNYYISEPAIGNFDNVASNGQELFVLYRESATVYDGMMLSDTGTVLKSQYETVGGIADVDLSTPNLNLINNDKLSGSSDTACAIIYYSSAITNLVCFYGQALTYTTNEVALGTNYTPSNNGFNARITSPAYITSGALLTNEFTFKYALPNMNYMYWVDYKNNGGYDVIASNITTFFYLDSTHANNAPSITSFDFGTGSPSCVNIIQEYEVTATDPELNNLSCWITYTYSNDSVIYNSTAKSINSGVQATFLYGLNETGTFKAKAYCRDDYGGSDTETRVQVVSNSSCNNQGENPSEQSYVTTAEATADADFQSDVNQLIEGVGVNSTKGKAFLALIICLIAAISVFAFTKNVIMSAVTLPVTMLMCYFLGLTGIFPLVVLILICAAMITYGILKPSTGG